MQLRFESDQQYQLDAVASVVDLFEGQPRRDAELAWSSAGFAAVANRLDLDGETILSNLAAVQEQNQISADEALQLIEEPIMTVEGEKTTVFPNFSVEMETGTGKTYVYLRTALELREHYGLRKFIIVVPSVAIREGVLKTLQVTEKHLRELYDNPPYRFYVYSSGNLNVVRQFALSDGIELMVMTIDSFSRDEFNVIYQDTDRLQGETPIHLVQATRPVLILDEPQNMESELRVRALAALDPLLALRYSATHKNPYNLVYRLTPYDAYRQNLVKRIEVAGVEREADANQVFMRLAPDGIRATKKKVTARLTVHKLMKSGAVKEKTVTVSPGDSLTKKTGLPHYEGFEVDEIIPGYGVRFSNDVEIQLGDARGADRDAIFQSQIRYTLEQHIIKQRRLREKGLKVLSLFFIDRVDNYASEGGIIRALFEKAFNEVKHLNEDWKDKDAAAVQGAYFAQRRRKTGAVEQVDSVTGTAEADREAYDLIMRDKERLLSFDEAVCFIFSHSALREGWDNPNVFQICTLNQTVSEMKKRQEVGRGIRLAVNQEGERVRDPQLNVLTVVANESYESYVRQFQSEIEDEYGADGLPPKPGNARKRAKAKLRKSYMLKPEFKELWERIKHKTRYAVRIDAERLLEEVVPRIDAAEIKPLRVMVRKAAVDVGDDGFEARLTTAPKKAIDLSGRQPPPNLIDSLAHLLEQTSPPVRLTRRTLFEIFNQCENKQAALANPHEWASAAHRIIREQLADQIVSGIEYEKNDEWYDMRLFENDAEIEAWNEYLVPSERSLYDHVVFQSNIERRFVEDLEAREDVKVYVKLPGWFKVATPVGEYNPDWAIVKEEDGNGGERVERIYLVAETKGTVEIEKLRPSEQRKVKCGRRHFERTLGVDFRVVTNAAEL
jgi:type III restriction enzyme